jgi:ribosomal protein S18 acetylase RimI-like enzyme
MRVRVARTDDLPVVYRICEETGFPPIDVPRTPELLGHVYAGPYLVGPYTRSRVVVDDAGVGGYLLCATDAEAFEQWQDEAWWPSLREDFPLHVPGRSRSDQEVVALIHDPPRAPAWVLEEHPAHLHIDLLPRLQGAGLGPRLIAELLDALHARGVRGVHLDVGADNARGIAVYRRLGFKELDRGEDSIFMGRSTSAR